MKFILIQIFRPPIVVTYKNFYYRRNRFHVIGNGNTFLNAEKLLLVDRLLLSSFGFCFWRNFCFRIFLGTMENIIYFSG